MSNTQTPTGKGGRADLLGGSIGAKNSNAVEDHQRRRYPRVAGFKGDPGGPGADAARALSPQIRGRRREALEGLRSLPGACGTAEQVAAVVGRHWYVTRPRLSELKALGEIVDTGERGPSAFGGWATIYRVATAQERALFLARLAVENEKRGDL